MLFFYTFYLTKYPEKKMLIPIKKLILRRFLERLLFLKDHVTLKTIKMLKI